MPQNPRPAAIVYWTIWAAIFFAVFAYQFILGHGLPRGANAPGAGLSPIALIAIAAVIVATIVRWLVIPRTTDGRQLLILLIIGMALSETPTLFEIFLLPASMPETKLLIFGLSVVSCAQFAPIYVGRE
jgi:hypothetical protein